MKCPHCHAENPAGMRFCGQCAAPLASVCPSCGASNPPEHKFCGQCAASLGEAAKPRFGPPESYTPKHLAEKILTSKSAIEGERKQVTVLFCDIANSTALAERLGPDAMHSLLDRFFELALGEVHRYEGTINQFLGDGFMALFGAPVAHEDHARRAALVALGIQRGVRERQDEIAGPAVGALAVRIGMNTGPVVVGKIGDNLRMDYTAVGDTTNLAARLQQIAEPSAIYASDATYRLIEPYIECEPLGERKLKGKVEVVAVYRLAGARARRDPSPRGVRPIGSPLVGRDTELETLARCLERVLAGHGAIVGVLGEAGLGKSRLVTEASRSVAGRGLLWLEGRALSFGQNLSYWPFLEILRLWAGITEEDSEAQSALKLERHIGALFPDNAADVLPYLATLMGLPVSSDLEHRVKYLDGQAMGRQIFRSVRRLFERLARERPVVLVFEDLHWMDQSSTELIEHLFPLVQTVPIVLCGMGRPERESPAARLRQVARSSYVSHYTEIQLAALPPGSTTTLVENLLVNSAVPGRLKDLIIRKAEGNPFFVEEVIRAIVAGGVLVWDGAAEQWRMGREVEQVTLPDTLQGVIMARVDRLDEDVKQVLKVASVIGRSFFYRVLQALAEAGRELDRHLEGLEQLELIREKRRLPELEYFFKHALVQEATYDSILVERRRQLHRRVGECIERLFGDHLEEFYGVLAYHYARAEDWQRAQDYLFKAGDHAGRVAADAEALAHYQEAIRAYERVFGDHWEPLPRAILERKIGEALFRRGEHEQALDYTDRARARLGLTLPSSRWGIRLAIAGQLVRQAGHRLLPGVFLRHAAETSDRVVEELVRLAEITGWIEYFKNQERFVAAALIGLNYFERHRHPVGLTLQYMSIGLISDAVSAFGIAERYHRRAVTLAESTQHPIAIAHAYFGAGSHKEVLGDFDQAFERYQRAATAFREAGHPRGYAGAISRIAYIFHHRGDFARALNEAVELIRLGEETSDREILAWGLMVRGMVRRCTGPLDEAIADLHRAIEVLERISDHASIAQTGGLLGACYLRQGQVGKALVVLERAKRTVTERRLRGFTVVWAPMVLAEAYLRAVDEARGAQQATMMKKAKRACQEAMKQGKLCRYWFPMAFRLRGTFEWRTGKHRAAERSWLSSMAVADAIAAPYEVALTCLEMGRCLERRAHLERAADIFARIGAHVDLAEAHRLVTGVA